MKYEKEYTGETKLWTSEIGKWHKSTKVSNTIQISQGNFVAIDKDREIHIGTNLSLGAIVWLYNFSICRSFRYFDSQFFTSYCVRIFQTLNWMLLHSGQVLVIKHFLCNNFFFHWINSFSLQKVITTKASFICHHHLQQQRPKIKSLRYNVFSQELTNKVIFKKHSSISTFNSKPFWPNILQNYTKGLNGVSRKFLSFPYFS